VALHAGIVVIVRQQIIYHDDMHNKTCCDENFVAVELYTCVKLVIQIKMKIKVKVNNFRSNKSV